MERVKHVTVTLEISQIDALDGLAQRSHLTRSALARLAVARLLREPVFFLPSALTQDHQGVESESLEPPRNGRRRRKGGDAHAPAAGTPAEDAGGTAEPDRVPV